jgi:hypothetical protein
MTFAKGAALADPGGLFNASLAESGMNSPIYEAFFGPATLDGISVHNESKQQDTS